MELLVNLSHLLEDFFRYNVRYIKKLTAREAEEAKSIVPSRKLVRYLFSLVKLMFCFIKAAVVPNFFSL